MKLLLFLFISINALAEDNVRDLMYFPNQGDLWGQTSYSSTDSGYDLEDTKSRTNSNSLTQVLYYGSSQNLSVYAEITQSLSSTTKTGSNKYKSEGTENPSIGFVSRIQTQKENGYALFIQGEFSPDLIEAKDSSTTKKGNAARGGSSTKLSAIIGKKNKANQHKFELTLRLNSATTEEPASGSGENETDPTSTFSVDYTLQHDLSNNLSMIGGVSWLRFSASDSRSASGTETDVDAYTILGYAFGVKFAISQEFVLQGTYAQTIKKDVELSQDGTDYELEDFYVNSIRFEGSYKF